MRKMVFCLWLVVSLTGFCLAQSESATLSGRVTDPQSALIVGADVLITNTATNITVKTATNEAGIYAVPNLKPGAYRVAVRKAGFREVVKTGLVLHVQDSVSENFMLQIGSTTESITVEAGAQTIQTQSASVGTVIDRQFVANIPLNGRSFQTLIAMVPGIVMTPVAANGGEQGQFSANGQRTNTNYFTVDGVSANFGIPVFQSLSQGTSGSWTATNIQGSFSNLVAVDALQEFKIQTSTFAPEFGRSPGAQVSLVTRSGQNAFHGSAFEYFRNDVTDGKDWFDSKKPPLRYNDFGGTLGGPIFRNRTFFFFSYEGQRFLLPKPTVASAVPSLDVRKNAPNATARMLLEAFPLPNGPVILNAAGAPTDGALFNISYSAPNHSDAYSLRLDHNFTDRISTFARYNYSPSDSFSRAVNNFSMGNKYLQKTETLTLGSTQILSNRLVNEFRLNGSRQNAQGFFVFDGYGGGKQPDASIFLANLPEGARYYLYYIYSITDATGYPIGVSDGTIAKNQSRSINFVDNLSFTRGRHALKFGFDYRWYAPRQSGNAAIIGEYFNTVSEVYNLLSPRQYLSRSYPTNIVSPNYSSYAQDTWTISPRLTLTYGLRWEINPPPYARSGKALVTLTEAPDLSNFDMTGLQLAPLGTPYWDTSYTNFAPRFGVAYQLRQDPGRELVVRGGWGMFYDLASTPFASNNWPYTYSASSTNIPIPVQASYTVMPPPNFTPSATNRASNVNVAAKDFTLPRTYQWNFSVEQGLGRNQSLTLGYVGSAGRKLLRSMGLQLARPPATAGAYFSTNFSSILYVTNQSSSDYHSMQLQFNRRMAKGLQGLINYTWSHSTDDNSSVNSATAPAYIYPTSVNHGASDFDVRHNFSAAFTYEIPSPRWNAVADAVLSNWSLNGTFFARSGLPFDIKLNETNPFGFYQSIRRPDLVPGVPIIVDDPAAPGGWRINSAVDAAGNPVAFKAPPTNVAQGNMGRNSLYGFGAWQSDIGVHRTFKVTERIKAEFRVEAFNIFNHPNFINPRNSVNFAPTTGKFTVASTFGKSYSSMARGYGGGGNTGGFNPLFQVGGPRSMQFALKVSF